MRKECFLPATMAAIFVLAYEADADGLHGHGFTYPEGKSWGVHLVQVWQGSATSSPYHQYQKLEEAVHFSQS